LDKRGEVSSEVLLAVMKSAVLSARFCGSLLRKNFSRSLGVRRRRVTKVSMNVGDIRGSWAIILTKMSSHVHNVSGDDILWPNRS
jgi:hypothetical protein